MTQYATADLIQAIAYEGHDAGDDPAWASSGAPTRATYRRWCSHMCGIACLRMALLHRDGRAPTMFQLLAGTLHHGAYVQQSDGDIKGLIYRPFTQYTRATHALPADVHTDLPMERLITLLDAGQMVMTSVHKWIRHPEQDPPKRGGHLVLATGHRDGQIFFRNPSGHTPETRATCLPVDRFAAFFAERGVSLNLPA
ncbi:C39 family peptidase [Streptomyces sp. NPDC056296]|uniref:C39 family peptidase n=1 Tax=Streptomyces sp. NPDC056296 TaxID=3345775 RepID=UPI0035DB12AA